MKFTQKVDLGLKLIDAGFRTSFKNLTLFIYLPIYYIILARIPFEFIGPLRVSHPPSIQVFLVLLVFNLIAASITHYIYTKSNNKEASILTSLLYSWYLIIPLTLYSLLLLPVNSLMEYLPQFIGISIIGIRLLQACIDILFFLAIPFIVIKKETIVDYFKMTFSMWPTILAVSIGFGFVLIIIILPFTLLGLIPSVKEAITAEVAQIIKPILGGLVMTLLIIIQTLTYLKCQKIKHQEI